MMIPIGTTLKSNNIEDECVMEVFTHRFLQIGTKVNLYLLDHPLSRSSFPPRCRLIYFELNRIFQNFSPHKAPKIIVYTSSENWAPCANIIFLRRFGSRLFVVGRRFVVAIAVITLGGESRPNAGALPLVCLSRRVTDIIDRGLPWYQKKVIPDC